MASNTQNGRVPHPPQGHGDGTSRHEAQPLDRRVAGRAGAPRLGVSSLDVMPEPALDEHEVRRLLAQREFIARDASVDVAVLSGGVSGDVVLASFDATQLVLKRPRERLAVAADWRIDPHRAENEARCLEFLASVLQPGEVPEVVFYDESSRTLAMRAAPLPRTAWKTQLLAGEVSLQTAQRVGELLARVHRLSSAHPSALSHFAGTELLRQGRTDPYHRAAAARHPDLAAVIEREARRVEGTRLTLTLGDVSPKNIFVYDDRVMFFDVEIAHWGDPAFDVAFCLTMLVLKSLVVAGRAPELRAAIDTLWTAYRTAVPDWPELEAHVLAELGCQLLARVDGKSPVEYITDDPTREEVRHIAGAILRRPIVSVAELLDRLRVGSLAERVK